MNLEENINLDDETCVRNEHPESLSPMHPLLLGKIFECAYESLNYESCENHSVITDDLSLDDLALDLSFNVFDIVNKTVTSSPCRVNS